MLSLNTSVPRHAGGMGAKQGEVAKNNPNLPMTQPLLMPSTPRSTSSAHWHSHSALHQSSALVTPRPTPSRPSIQSPPLGKEDGNVAAAMERTSTDLDAAHLLASIASQMTAEEEAVVGTSGLDKSPSSPRLGVGGHTYKSTDEAPPSPRLTYLCTVVDREEDGNRGTSIIARSALQDHRGPHVPKFASLQRGMPMMPPPALVPPPPMMMPPMAGSSSSSSPEQDMACNFRTRTISVDTADSYLAPDLAYLRNGYESGRLSGVPSTFVSVPTIISPPSSPSSGPQRRPMDPPIGTTVSSPKRKKKHDDSPKEALVDAFLEDEEEDYVDAGADANDEDDEEYLPAATRRSRKKHKSHKAASAVVPSGGGSSSRTKSARTARKGVYVPASALLKNHKGTIQPARSLQPRCSSKGGESNPKFRIVLREKFSWKLYPELEAFLIANRDEYLRHSALNYTVEQKTYNNELTQRLIDLASTSGYVFDEQTFSFVCVRDRIRCYFKSYVQSRKKQGIVIGFAAKRAGLIKPNELKKIAASKAKIIVPPSSPKASPMRQKAKK